MAPTEGPAASESSGLVEPLLDARDIQGDSLAGFRKDQEHFVFLRIEDRAGAKAALRTLVPRISPLSDVHAFNQLFRAVRRRRGEIPGTLTATWANIAFTAAGLRKLRPADEVDRFGDEAFKLGLAARSGLLGDPVDPRSPGHPKRWVFGGPDKPVDAVLLVAADDPDALERTSQALLDVLTRPPRRRGATGFSLVHVEPCATRPDLPGHEHFGFRDGISQPAPRGRVAHGSDGFLSPRLLDPADERAPRFARPGQALVWPGEFVLGLERQTIPPDDDLVPLAPEEPEPAWARNGSYLVVRRLRQDVAAFRRFARDKAAELAKLPGFRGMTADRLQALIVGRWPSGAPLPRAPGSDDAALGADDFASNDFAYANAHAPCRLAASAHHPPDTFRPPLADPAGGMCPHGAHVRKVNPRDQGTDIGGPRATLRRLILRRGMPFGTPYVEGRPARGDRGLMFACYQASIQDQFEFLTTNWVNSDRKPRNDPGGHDILIGQSTSPSAGRARELVLTASDGSQHSLGIDIEWVVPTGGGYFFAPSISAIRDVLAPDR